MIDQVSEIVFNNKITSNIFLIGLMSSHIARTAGPGQFVMIRTGKGLDPLLRRPFSICGTLGDDLFMVLYRVAGRGTAILSSASKGESLSILGPLGKAFELSGSNKAFILAAGGMGIAPLYFLYQRIKKNRPVFFAGFSSSNEIVRPDKIMDMSMELKISTDDGSEGYRGMVTGMLDEYLKQQQIKSGDASLFACGPLPMLKTLSGIARDRRLPCYVSIESKMACGLGACQGCAVRSSSPKKKYLHACKDGPVFSALDIDWENI